MNQKTRESFRIKREKKTLKAMIRIYCRGVHPGRNHPCQGCTELQEYALARLDKCPFGASKGACNQCPIHCYKPDMRERIREVMRYAGPRMFFPHPLLSLFHFLDRRKKFPDTRKKDENI